MTGEFEKAAADKTKKYNKTLETAMSTYKIMDGPDQGKYERIQGYKDLSWFNSDMTSGAGYKYWQKNVAPTIADIPVAKPSKPSVKFTALDDPTTTKTEKKHHKVKPMYKVVSFKKGKANIPCNDLSVIKYIHRAATKVKNI